MWDSSRAAPRLCAYPAVRRKGECWLPSVHAKRRSSGSLLSQEVGAGQEMGTGPAGLPCPLLAPPQHGAGSLTPPVSRHRVWSPWQDVALWSPEPLSMEPQGPAWLPKSAPRDAPGPVGRLALSPLSVCSGPSAVPRDLSYTGQEAANLRLSSPAHSPRSYSSSESMLGVGSSLPFQLGFLLFVCLDDPYVGSKKLKHFILVVFDPILLGSGDSSPVPDCGRVEYHHLYRL